jgi:hypothetical protein
VECKNTVSPQQFPQPLRSGFVLLFEGGVFVNAAKN